MLISSEVFIKQLKELVRNLSPSASSAETLQDSVSPLWTDNNYRAFRRIWDNFVRKYHEHLQNYGPRHIKLLLLYSCCLISPSRNIAINWNTPQWHKETQYL